MSTAYTIQRVFNAIPDTSLVIGGAGYQRRMEIGGDWIRIRFGMLCSIGGTASFTNAMLMLGLSSSSGPAVNAYNTLNFVGASLLGAPSPLGLTYETSLSVWYFRNAFSAAASIVRKRLSSYPTNIAGSAASYFAPTFYTDRKRRTPFVVDIARPVGGTGLATVTVYGCNATTVAFDYRPDHLWQALEATGVPVINGQTLTTLATSAAVAVGEELGTLDTFDLYWSRYSYPLDVYALGATVTQKKYSAWLPEPHVIGAYESYEFYPVANSVGTLPAAPLFTDATYGTFGAAGWASEGTLFGYSNPYFGAGYYGTVSGNPLDTFQTYTAGTAASQALVLSGSVSGTLMGWASAGTFIGTCAPIFGTGYVGTATGLPYDGFETYADGTYSTSLPDYGTGWLSSGTFVN